MKIAFFSGSFDPPHTGHIAVAKYLYKKGLADEVWLSPTPHNPCKNIEQLSPLPERVDMATLAVAPFPYIKLCDIEQHLPQPSYTINTLRALRERYPQHQFSLIIGADNWAIINRWKDYQNLIAEFPLFIYPRQGAAIDIPAAYTTVQVIAAPPINISSTEIRAALQNGKNLDPYLPGKVHDYILNHHLYHTL